MSQPNVPDVKTKYFSFFKKSFTFLNYCKKILNKLSFLMKYIVAKLGKIGNNVSQTLQPIADKLKAFLIKISNLVDLLVNTLIRLITLLSNIIGTLTNVSKILYLLTKSIIGVVEEIMMIPVIRNNKKAFDSTISYINLLFTNEFIDQNITSSCYFLCGNTKRAKRDIYNRLKFQQKLLMEQLHKTMLLHQRESNSHSAMIKSMNEAFSVLNCTLSISVSNKSTMDHVIKSSNDLVKAFFTCKLNKNVTLRTNQIGGHNLGGITSIINNMNKVIDYVTKESKELEEIIQDDVDISETIQANNGNPPINPNVTQPSNPLGNQLGNPPINPNVTQPSNPLGNQLGNSPINPNVTQPSNPPSNPNGPPPSNPPSNPPGNLNDNQKLLQPIEMDDKDPLVPENDLTNNVITSEDVAKMLINDMPKVKQTGGKTLKRKKKRKKMSYKRMKQYKHINKEYI